MATTKKTTKASTTAKSKSTKKKETSSVDDLAAFFDGAVAVAGMIESLAKAAGPHVSRLAKLKDSDSLPFRLPSPADRLGQKGLERRVANVRRTVEEYFVTGEVEGHAELLLQVERLEKALGASSDLPLMKRKSAHSRIDSQLDRIEVALMNALIPTD